MSKLVFYRQKHYDGAVRTGVELAGEAIAERFERGGDESDPRLLWFIDLRCDGAAVPDDIDDALPWLLNHSDVIRKGFSHLAEQLRAGVDKDIFALTWSEFEDLPTGVSMTIACSAIRRVNGLEMSSYLSEVGENWDTIIEAFDVPQEVEDVR